MTDLHTQFPELNSIQLKALHRILLEEVVGADESLHPKLLNTDKWNKMYARNELKTKQRATLNQIFNIDEEEE